MKPIWIVDDDQSIRWVLEKALARENFTTRSFSGVRDALAALEGESPQVLVSDIRMPGGSGLELLQTVRDRLPGLPVIIMTAFSDLDSAVAAFQGGAFEYLAKPFDVDKAVELIRRAVDESMRGEASVDERVTETPEMLGQAPAMQDMFRAIGRLSHSAATVLITGESGTGKELVARALHRHSPRANGPFIALNTAAIPKDLLESELFGHERGAFTGAQAMRQGRFEQAENGTLFLDEIGDMPFDLQTRLLRVLSDGQFYRVGGHNPLKANVRVIAATHQNLESRVRQGLFREDLYHRLNVIRLRLPALRERSEDIPLLTRHFLQKSARDLGVEPKRVSDDALAYLASLPFPGNVRQLENLCNWLTVMAPAQVIEQKDLPPDLTSRQEVSAESLAVSTDGAVAPVPNAVNGAGSAPIAAAPAGVAASVWENGLRTEVARLLRENSADVMDELARRFEAAVIREALDFTRGRKVEAAERLGIGRNTITRKIQELHLDA
ncbi:MULTISPECIES: nitrogen regulation protein NR(I) [Caballeronia]|jgi:two-component system nitrogen regulation response regulator GlnG|uniref:nitrogen regulation protein NR(I) n=1 Tax=Caballeronia TaxID=1827195 RepID=UPI00025BA5F1|nr:MULTISPECIES: nitrogen regulation protein NR(I) [Caballeronia]EKS68187.1 nitrogen metabolism transcriptional regulator, NtrC, Fis family protein [Burkholderia sp. SJ98]MCG7404959.1 nitrogen regulation protein NR(I) [Caballeronia zhejiangensis]MCI1042816.1 nitrogen regulation protein NR(I) [Caballeronia zhejiangensis]MDR5764729.1 nitrogen regulation protein NR(I) [Caballeronia sp. LZ028]MDR5787728.1 nitrogen regulation protein NR(I) [Caballeronia sp. LP003]